MKNKIICNRSLYLFLKEILVQFHDISLSRIDNTANNNFYSPDINITDMSSHYIIENY